MAPQSPVHRARRFSIPGLVSFRAAGGVSWIEASIVNISRTGLLMAAAREGASQGDHLFLLLTLPCQARDECAAISCSGRVVRVDDVPPDGGVLVGVRILRYKLRGMRGDSRG